MAEDNVQPGYAPFTHLNFRLECKTDDFIKSSPHVIGGMLAAVFIGLFFLPHAFYIISRMKKSPRQEPPEAAAAAATPPGTAQ